MKENDIQKKDGGLGAWVPQLFYDIIARIIPGFFVLIIILINVLDANQFFTYLKGIMIVDKTHDLSANMLFLLGLCISYILAIVLRAINYLILNPLYRNKGKKFDPETDSDSNEIPWSDLGVKDCKLCTNDLALRYDFIKLRDTVNGNRITKLKAEVQMSGTLFVGLLLAAFINSVMLLLDFSYSRCIVLFTTIFIGGFCLGAKVYFKDRLRNALYNCSELLGFQKYLQELIKSRQASRIK